MSECVDRPDVSVVMPCRNEAGALPSCIAKARKGLADAGLTGEIVIADNGSTDGSPQIAEEQGARVVHEPRRGYGRAYKTGLAAARGRLIMMGDADDTYDFSALPGYYAKLQEGYDLVNGNRLKGNIEGGSMPWLHHHIGNPFLTWLLNSLFHTGLTDVYCGMRLFTREAYQRIAPRSNGMEFALEMLINAAKAGLRTAEIPITLHQRIGEAKLRTFRDGYRSVRFMLLYSPTWLFLVPGAILSLVGFSSLVGIQFGLLRVAGHELDIHFMTLASFVTILGVQVLWLGLCARTYSLSEEFDQEDQLLLRFYRLFKLETGLVLGLALFAIGVLIDAGILWRWVAQGFGPLYAHKAAVFAATLMGVGVQTVFSSFFISLMSLRKSLDE